MSGAGIPFIVTELTSLNAVESGTELATERPAAKPLPKIEMREPGDTVVLTELIVWARTVELANEMQPTSANILHRMVLFSQIHRGNKRFCGIVNILFTLLSP